MAMRGYGLTGNLVYDIYRHTTKVPRVAVLQPTNVHARGEHVEATDQRWGRRWTERAAQGSAYALHGR
jgi:hypothetical protein